VVVVDMVVGVMVADIVVVEVRQGFGKGRSQGAEDGVARQHAGHHETRRQENQWHILRKNPQSP